MGHFKQHKHFYNQPIRLSNEEQGAPMKVIAGFFNTFHLHEVRQLLSNSLETAVTTNNNWFSRPEDRNTLLIFYKCMEELMEAAHLINEQNKLLVKHGPGCRVTAL